MDGSIPRKPEQPKVPKWMQAIVIGGVANGVLLPRIRTDATVIELSRPDYLKPLAYSKQETPEVERATDQYEVCTIFLDRGDGAAVPFGICVLQGQSMLWAISRLTEGFIRNVLNELSAENLKQ